MQLNKGVGEIQRPFLFSAEDVSAPYLQNKVRGYAK